MKILKKSIFYLFATLMLAGCENKLAVEANYGVVPLPQNVTMTDAKPFKVDGSTKIVYPKDSNIQKQTAEFLASYIKFSTGLDLKVTDEALTENAIVLKNDYKADRPESYHLTVDEKAITINGSDDAGTFYGVQTLRKSIPAETESVSVSFPAVDIKDYPRFSYRGMHLDVGRHFFPVEFVKKYIDILALHNLNRFHWHLTEDQGWRIEIKKYPKLTEVGSQRSETVIGRNSGEFDGTPYGGFYTQEEIKEVVEYAKERFITVIPEIDLPGHMLAALAAYPHLGCTGGPYEVEKTWGVFDDVLCAGNDSVYTFIEDVLGEVIELFPSEYIHIGGDESPKTRWKSCPKCQAKIKSLGLKGDAHHSAEDRLQSHVITSAEKFLNSKGRQIIGWDEILEGGLAPNATVMSWQGISGGITAAQQGHDVIMTPNQSLYFNYYQTRDTENEPLAIGGYVPIQMVYEYEPVPAELTDDQKKYIIGTQANLWSEYIATPELAEYMLLPRIAALSEIQWTMPEKKDYKTFLPRLERMMKLYKKLGYNYAKHISDIAADVVYNTEKGVVEISLFTYDNAPIYYTLDGSEPTESSTLYTTPIVIDSTQGVKAIAIRQGEKSNVYTNSFDFNKATLKNIKIDAPIHRAYTSDGGVTLVNGKRGGDLFGNGQWLGFNNTDFVATIDLGESMDVSKVITGTFHEGKSWIFGATEYIVELSEDGKAFKRVYEQKYPVLTKDAPNGTFDLVASFDLQKARYVKITAKATPKVPDWHEGRGNPTFLFVDEIIVE